MSAPNPVLVGFAAEVRRLAALARERRYRARLRREFALCRPWSQGVGRGIRRIDAGA